MVDVIVQYRLRSTPAHHDKVRGLGGKLNRELLGVKGGAYSLQASGVKELANDPDVAYITPDRVVAAYQRWIMLRRPSAPLSL